jgi:hypothetical protein
MLKTHNWNVYKIFKNGKRAKLSTCQIVADTVDDAEKIFLREFLPVLPEKYSAYGWTYVQEGDNQERAYEKQNERNAKFKKIRDRFFAKRAIKISGIPNNIAIALVMNKQSNWKWQWAACQPATSKYIVGLSPLFDTSFEADAWLKDNINEKI